MAQIAHGSESAYFLRPGITHVIRLTLYSLRTEKLMQNSKANLMPRNQIPLIWPAVATFATTRTEKLMINSKANLTYLNQFPRFATTQAPFVVCDPIQKNTSPRQLHAFYASTKSVILFESIDKDRVA